MNKNSPRWKTNIRKVLLILATHIGASYAGGIAGSIIWVGLFHSGRPLINASVSFLFPLLGVGGIWDLNRPLFGSLLCLIAIGMLLCLIRFWKTGNRWLLVVYCLPLFLLGVMGGKVLSAFCCENSPKMPFLGLK